MLNSTQRSSMLITKNTFEVRCKDSELIKLFFYDGVSLSEQILVFTDIGSGFKVATVDSETEGHYFIIAGRNFQSLRKGYSSIKMFFYDNKQRSDLVLEPMSYDNDGVFIGENDYSYIGNGIYVVEPVVQTPSVVEIFGKIYYSFIYDPAVQTFALQGPSTPIGIDVVAKSFNIKVSDDIDLDMSIHKNDEIGIDVIKRNFTIKVNDGEDPDMDVDKYDPILIVK